MNEKNIVAVRDAKMRYDNAVKSNMQVHKMRQEYINTLMNNADDLLKAADELNDLQKEYGELVQENMRLQQEAKAASTPKKNKE